MKIPAALVLAAVPFMALASDSPRFSDVPEDAWFASYVHAAADAGIVNGYADAHGNLTGKFGPSDLVTLGQALKIAVEGAGYEPSRYSTVYAGKNETWLSPYYRVAMNEGFGTFVGANEEPDSFASRQVVARAIADAFGLVDRGNYPKTPLLKSPYSDVDMRNYDEGHSNVWTYAILKLTADGVVSGDTDAEGRAVGRFRPNDPVNRAEVVKMVMKARQVYGTPAANRFPRFEVSYMVKGMFPAGPDSYVQLHMFAPEKLEVTAGSTVVFRNDDEKLNLRIAVSEDSGGFDDFTNATLERVIERGESFSFTFHSTGLMSYYNAFNPADRGTIVVVP